MYCVLDIEYIYFKEYKEEVLMYVTISFTWSF